MMRREVEDVAELMHRIQSRLPVEEAARTCVLSKSWLHAWSTIPTLRFYVLNTRKRKTKSMKLVEVERTLIRYLRDSIPIQLFELVIDIENQELASHAEKWIHSVSTKTCLKKIFLSIFPSSVCALFTLPDEILLGENLTSLRVLASRGTVSVRMTTSHHPVIKCVSLRELHLDGVCISEETLNLILSSCSLLVKIELSNIYSDSCEGFKTIKVINLPFLYALSIGLDGWQSTSLEIRDVPNLGVFSYDLFHSARLWDPHPLPFNSNAHSISLGRNVTHLMLGGVIADNAGLDMIKSGFPFLMCLTLYLTSWMLGSFHFTCASIKRLSLQSCPKSLIDVQVHAPKLLFFDFHGDMLPSLLFPDSSLWYIKLSLSLNLPVDADFFLKMREALTLSQKCDLRVTTRNNSKLPFNIEDLRTRLLFPPATNVQKFEFQTVEDECLSDRSPFFDAFFEICHPKHVYAKRDMMDEYSNHFCSLMLSEMTTGTTFWSHHLKDVQIRRHKKWETLTDCPRSFLHGNMHFKLYWC
ncbi:uncharacterized protein LOC111909991 isoform X2 [Lactuca sativa]|nr:uncharacterized protein LOC111909991 isoform X2 [Lactuca sativa]